MLESPANINEEISNDKSPTSEPITQLQNSSPTSAPASTGTAVASKTFWNVSSAEKSRELWLPYVVLRTSSSFVPHFVRWFHHSTKTDSLDSPWNSSSGSSDELMCNSWFSANQTISSAERELADDLLSIVTVFVARHHGQRSAENRRRRRRAKQQPKKKKAKTKKNPKTDKEPAGKAKKIRLYPNKKEEETLMRWIGTARWTYNECLRAVQSDENVPRNKKALRARALNDDAITRMDKPWLRDTPYDVRDEAMNDLLKAYDSGFARKKNDGKPFELKPRSRKHSAQESIVIHSKHYKTEAWSIFIHCQNARRRTAARRTALRCTDRSERRTNVFYLCVPMPLEVRAENQGPIEKRVIALDPGVRTFMTGYDPHGVAFEFGRQDIGRIYRLCHAVDDLQSRWSQKGVDHHRRWRMRRAGARIRTKIRHLVDDLHCKLVKFLVRRYTVVLLPKFATSQMLRKGQRRIRSKTARAMATWSHDRFQQRLLNKMREYPWCKVVIVNEAWTSKTCGRCGWIHQQLGGNKVFRCGRCHLECDRDLHAARNILLRFISSEDA